ATTNFDVVRMSSQTKDFGTRRCVKRQIQRMHEVSSIAVGFTMTVVVCLPHFPMGSSAPPKAFQLLLVFKRVHARPKAIIRVANQLPFLGQPLKGFTHQFFFLADVMKDSLFENEKASINSHCAITDGLNRR